MIHLLDSNIIIYTSMPENQGLASFLSGKRLAASLISFVEVLGYHKLTEEAKADLESFFRNTKVYPISLEIVRRAVALRQARKCSLGDSIIGATALTEGCTLVTRNTRDFSWMPNLRLLDPFDR